MNTWNSAGLSDDSGSPIWKRLLELQTKLLIPSELSIYCNCEGWLRARSVLDAGTGYGDYLLVLHELFPEKRFIGIDCNYECIDYASGRFQNGRPNLSYICSDLFDKAKAGLHDLCIAETQAQAGKAFNHFVRDFGAKSPKAVEKLVKKRAGPIGLLRLPGRALDSSPDDPHQELCFSEHPAELGVPIDPDRRKAVAQAAGLQAPAGGRATDSV